MIKRIIIFTVLFVNAFCIQAKGNQDNDYAEFDISNGEQVLKEYGYSDIEFDEILLKLSQGHVLEVIKDGANYVYEYVIGDTDFIKNTLFNLVLIVIISGFFSNFANVFNDNNVSNTAFYICYICIILIVVYIFDFLSDIVASFVHMILDFMLGILPAYFVSVAITKQFSAVGFYQLVLIIISIVDFLFLNILIPAIKIYISISLVNNISKENILSKTTDVIKNFINYSTKFLVAMVTGLNIIQGLVLPSIDTAKNTTIKKVIGAIPIWGNGSDALTSIMYTSGSMVKNTIGTLAIILILIICMVPYIKIQVYSVVIQLITAFVQPVSDSRIISSFSSLNKGVEMLAKIVLSCGALFVLTIAIICIVS